MAEVIAELVIIGSKVVVKLIKVGWKAEEGLRDLKQNLEVIESYLSSADETEQSFEVVEQWLQKLGGVSVQARQQLDELEKMIDGIPKWNCEGLIPVAISTAVHVKIGHKVNNINKELKKILDLGTALGLQSRVNLATSSSSPSSVKNKRHFFTKIPRWLWRKMKKFINHLRRSDDYTGDYQKMNMDME